MGSWPVLAGIQHGDFPATVGPSRSWDRPPSLERAGGSDQDRGGLVRHDRRLVFQPAEVALPRELFRFVLARIARLRPTPGKGNRKLPCWGRGAALQVVVFDMAKALDVPSGLI